MRYFGGKQRIATHLAAFMRATVLERGSYVEPFVGGAAVLALQPAVRRIGNDANIALITMWRALSSGWTPPETVTEADYLAIKRAADPANCLTAFVGFGCSFAGKWFGGYARGGVSRNYAANAASSLRKKMRTLAGVEWCAGDYTACPTPDRSVIYCDPPYAGTTQYGAVGAFNWEEFWSWCLKKHAEGHAVFVSEYAAPSTFRAALEINTKTDIRTKAARGQERRVERLFVPLCANYGRVA